MRTVFRALLLVPLLIITFFSAMEALYEANTSSLLMLLITGTLTWLVNRVILPTRQTPKPLARPPDLSSAEIAPKRSRHIPTKVKLEVFRRDEGKCVLCGASSEIHFDHIIPWSQGGANTVENIQVLCAQCNLKKSDNIV